MAQVNLNLQESETYVCFRNKEGIFVFNQLKQGSASVEVNEHGIATSIAAVADLELSGFTFGELCPQIDLVREMKAKIEGLNENEVETLKNILA